MLVVVCMCMCVCGGGYIGATDSYDLEWTKQCTDSMFPYQACEVTKEANRLLLRLGIILPVGLHRECSVRCCKYWNNTSHTHTCREGCSLTCPLMNILCMNYLLYSIRTDDMTQPSPWSIIYNVMYIERYKHLNNHFSMAMFWALLCTWIMSLTAWRAMWHNLYILVSRAGFIMVY